MIWQMLESCLFPWNYQLLTDNKGYQYNAVTCFPQRSQTVISVTYQMHKNLSLRIDCNKDWIRVRTDPGKSWNSKKMRLPGLESPGKRHRSWNSKVVLISLDPVTQLAGLFWIHLSTLIQPQVLHLGLFTVMQLHQKLIWCVHFLTSCNHFCERSVSGKSLKTRFLSPGNPGIWSLQVLENSV